MSSPHGRSRPHGLSALRTSDAKREGGISRSLLFGTLGDEVGNATGDVTHLCPTKVVRPAHKQSTALFLNRRFAPEVENRLTILNVTMAHVCLSIRQ
jgi:hypothetical protein